MSMEVWSLSKLWTGIKAGIVAKQSCPLKYSFPTNLESDQRGSIATSPLIIEKRHTNFYALTVPEKERAVSGRISRMQD